MAIWQDLVIWRQFYRRLALYRSWAIPCAGEKVYSPRRRKTWLEQLPEAGCVDVRSNFVNNSTLR
jgi:hypothetical protein